MTNQGLKAAVVSDCLCMSKSPMRSWRHCSLSLGRVADMVAVLSSMPRKDLLTDDKPRLSYCQYMHYPVLVKDIPDKPLRYLPHEP